MRDMCLTAQTQMLAKGEAEANSRPVSRLPETWLGRRGTLQPGVAVGKNLSTLLGTFHQLLLFEGFRDDQSGGESDTYVTKPLQQSEIQH